MPFYKSVLKHYPGAIRGDVFHLAINLVLANQGATAENTLFANSTCPDELNRIISSLGNYWGENFILGGLAGFPFVGKTGFLAFASHVPNDGKMLILFGPHIGINMNGDLGNVMRRGMDIVTYCCGSSMSAYERISLGKEEDKSVSVNINEDDELDYQQKYITNSIKKYFTEISQSHNPKIELTEILMKEITQYLFNIIPQDYDGEIFLIGGIQVNTPLSESDCFVPRIFEKYAPKLNTHQNLLSKIQMILK